MRHSWPLQPLRNLVHHRKAFIRIDDLSSYKRCRVRLHAQGVVLRDHVQGAEIRTKSQQVCRLGDLLVAEIDAKVGGYGIVPDDLDGAIVSSHYFLFELSESGLDRRFLDYYIRTPRFFGQVAAQGSTNYAAVRPADVLAYQVPLPPVVEQRQIVARLDALAARIGAASDLRAQTEKLPDAILKSLGRRLAAGITAPVVTLGECVDGSRDGILSGPFGADLGTSDFTDRGVPVLNIGNIGYGGLWLGKLNHVTPEKALQLDRYRVSAGDLLFARMGTVGRCCVVPPDADGWLINYHIIRVALDKSRVEPRYVSWMLRVSQDVEEYLDRKIRGATRQGVNSAIVGGLPCRVPSLQEQRKIVNYLESLESPLEEVKRFQRATRVELHALLPAVLQKAFRGELMC